MGHRWHRYAQTAGLVVITAAVVPLVSDAVSGWLGDLIAAKWPTLLMLLAGTGLVLSGRASAMGRQRSNHSRAASGRHGASVGDEDVYDTHGDESKVWTRVQGVAAIITAAVALVAWVLSEEGQIADRYSTAIEQLGSETIDVRLGGIYSLERIMRDSPDDQPTLLEVLAAFIRIHAPGPLPPQGRNIPPAPDVQAALTVIGRREVAHDDHLLINLTQTYLHRVNLAGLNLAGADLSTANFSGAELTGADLTRANLTNTDLYAAKFMDTKLTGANLTNTDLSQADLTRADLTEAILDKANLTEANLNQAVLSGVDLTRVKGVTNPQLTCAVLVDSTNLPAGMAPARREC